MRTRGERKEILREKYRRRRDKIFGMLAIAVVFILLIALLGYAIHTQIDPFLIIVLFIAILVMIPVTIFFMDSIAWES